MTIAQIRLLFGLQLQLRMVHGWHTMMVPIEGLQILLTQISWPSGLELSALFIMDVRTTV